MNPARRTLKQGIVVGLIAYASVAVFYAAFDLLASRGTLYTVNLLGLAVFHQLNDASVLQMPITPDLGAISSYNALHLVLSVVIGLVVTSLVDHAEHIPSRRPAIVAVIIAGYFVTVGAVGMLSTPIRPVLPWWSIIVANGSAVVFSWAYLTRVRPGMWQRIMPGSKQGRD